VGHWAIWFIPLSLWVYSVGYCREQEEDDLRKRYGRRYEEYREKTALWLPTLK